VSLNLAVENQSLDRHQEAVLPFVPPAYCYSSPPVIWAKNIQDVFRHDISIGDVITVIERGMLICDKIKNRNESIIEITNRMTSLQRYLKPLKEFLEARNGLARQ
jgi:hypothetical protein